MAVITSTLTPHPPLLEDPPEFVRPVWGTHGPAIQFKTLRKVVQAPIVEQSPEDMKLVVRGGQPYQPRGLRKPVIAPIIETTTDPLPTVTRGPTNSAQRQRWPIVPAASALDFVPPDVPPFVSRFRGWIPPQSKVVRVTTTEDALPPDAMPQVLKIRPRPVPIPRIIAAYKVEQTPDDSLPTMSHTKPQAKPWPRPIVVWQESPTQPDPPYSFAQRGATFRPIPYPKTIQASLYGWDLLIDPAPITVIITVGGGKEPIPTPAIQRVVFITPITQAKNFPHCG